MRWPFRRSKASPVAQVTFAGLGLSDAVWPRLDANRLVHEGFNANIPVYAGIALLAQADAGIPWCLMKKGATATSKPTKVMTFQTAAKARALAGGRRAGRRTEVDDHPLLKLLERPNPFQGGAELQELRAAYLLMHGNNYTTAVGPSSGPPRELWTLRPDRMKVVPHPKLLVSGYVYDVGGDTQPFAAAKVLHRKFVSMDDDHYGRSPIAVAMRTVLTLNESVRWNYALLKNACRPPGAFVSKTATGLTDMQYNRLKTQTDADYAGAENAGRPMLLEGDLDWKAMGFAPAEMEWLAGMKDARRLIATVLGFAPELIGDSENKTYGNYGEARKALYQETVLPQKDRDLAALNNWLVPMFGDNLYLDYDRDQIEALEEDHEKLWSRVEASSVLTVNEKRELLGYDDVSTEEGGDAVLVSAAMTPLDDLARQATEKGTGNGPQGSDGV